MDDDSLPGFLAWLWHTQEGEERMGDERFGGRYALQKVRDGVRALGRGRATPEKVRQAAIEAFAAPVKLPETFQEEAETWRKAMLQATSLEEADRFARWLRDFENRLSIFVGGGKRR